ncbi:unnamed protein product [Trifolium pratense]|uniref:Uncharacterized protein n=1 Tax=Trifolium pratense TaxID=57577 RepID=A0ACB0J5U1_TRIPR|nr:unnamed protein product [Trifolium pratense]
MNTTRNIAITIMFLLSFFIFTSDICCLALEGRVLEETTCESDAQCHDLVECRRTGQVGVCNSGKCWCHYPPFQ